MKDYQKVLQYVDILGETIEELKIVVKGNKSSSDEKGSEVLVSIGDYAKVLRDMGIPFGRNKLYSWFYYRGFLYRQSDRNYAKDEYVKRGYFWVKRYIINEKTGPSIRETIYLTPLGVRYFTNMIAKEFEIQNRDIKGK